MNVDSRFVIICSELQTKYPQENFEPTKDLREKIWTHKTPASENFGPTKYSWEKILDSRRYDGEMAQVQQNLTHSVKSIYGKI